MVALTTTMDTMGILIITMLITDIQTMVTEMLVMQTEEEDTHLIHTMEEMPIGTL